MLGWLAATVNTGTRRASAHLGQCENVVLTALFLLSVIQLTVGMFRGAGPTLFFPQIIDMFSPCALEEERETNECFYFCFSQKEKTEMEYQKTLLFFFFLFLSDVLYFVYFKAGTYSSFSSQ